MLFLQFQLGKDRYALDTREIAEVLPLVDIAAIPRASPEVAGICNYRGTPVPVIDLSQLILGRPAQRRLHTRLVIVHYADAGGTSRLLGLIAEQATLTLRCDPEGFSAPGLIGHAAGHLGPVAMDADGLIQWTDVNQLLTPSVRERLFQPVADH